MPRIAKPKPLPVSDRLDMLENATKHNAKRVNELRAMVQPGDDRVTALEIQVQLTEGNLATVMSRLADSDFADPDCPDRIDGLERDCAIAAEKLESLEAAVRLLNAPDRFSDHLNKVIHDRIDGIEKALEALATGVATDLKSVETGFESVDRKIAALDTTERHLHKHICEVDHRGRELKSTVEYLRKPLMKLDVPNEFAETKYGKPTQIDKLAEHDRLTNERVLWFMTGAAVISGLFFVLWQSAL